MIVTYQRIKRSRLHYISILVDSLIDRLQLIRDRTILKIPWSWESCYIKIDFKVKDNEAKYLFY